VSNIAKRINFEKILKHPNINLESIEIIANTLRVIDQKEKALELWQAILLIK